MPYIAAGSGGKVLDEYHRNKSTLIQAFVLFILTARVVVKYADSYFHNRARLSLVKFIVLQALLLNKEGLSLTDLARYTSTERHNITTLIDRMRKEDLVTTKRGVADRRLVNVRLTEKGTEAVTRAFELSRDVINRVMQDTDEADLATFQKQLSVMNKNASDALT